MRNAILSLALSAGMLGATAEPAVAAQPRYYYYNHHYHTRSQYIRHRRHMKTLKRVGIGAAGGAAVGAVAGGAKGGLIGAGVGAAAGAIYDRSKKHHGHY